MVRDTIKKILNETKEDRYIKFVVDDYLKDAVVNDITIDFETSGELRDLGWDDEMLSFAYEQYGDYGFTQDPEDEDSFYYEGSDHIWDLEEVLMDMFYIFIDERVKTGEFVETLDGWAINQNIWEVETRDNKGYIFDWNCSRKYYNMTFRLGELKNVLRNRYGAPENILPQMTDMIVEGMTSLLDNKKKFCE